MNTRVTPALHDAHPVTTGTATTPDPRETTAVTDLTDRQIAMLEFEAEWWRWTGAKAEAVADEFGTTLDAHHAELDELTATDGALEHDLLLVKRLRRQAQQRARQGPTPAPRRRPSGPLYGPDGLRGGR